LSDPPLAAPPYARSRVRRLALAGQVCAWGSIAALGGAVIWYCVDLDRFAGLAHELLPAVPVTIGPWAWPLGALMVGLMFGLFAWIMLEVANLFRLFGRGDLFGSRVERGLHRLSCAMIAGALGGVAGRTLLGLILSWNNAPHHRQLSINISSSDLLALLAAVMFLLFARIVAEARRAVEENQGFV
jgi:hypothetical protein